MLYLWKIYLDLDPDLVALFLLKQSQINFYFLKLFYCINSLKLDLHCIIEGILRKSIVAVSSSQKPHNLNSQ